MHVQALHALHELTVTASGQGSERFKSDLLLTIAFSIVSARYVAMVSIEIDLVAGFTMWNSA